MSISRIYSTKNPIAETEDSLWLASCPVGERSVGVAELKINNQSQGGSSDLCLKIYEDDELLSSSPVASFSERRQTELTCELQQFSQHQLVLTFSLIGTERALLKVRGRIVSVQGFVCALFDTRSGITDALWVSEWCGVAPVARFAKGRGCLYIVGGSESEVTVSGTKDTRSLSSPNCVFAACISVEDVLSCDWLRKVASCDGHFCVADAEVGAGMDRRLSIVGQIIGKVVSGDLESESAEGRFASWILLTNAEGKATVLQSLGLGDGLCAVKSVTVRGSLYFITGKASGSLEFDRVTHYGTKDSTCAVIAGYRLTEGALTPFWSCKLEGCHKPVFARSNDDIVHGTYFWRHACLSTQTARVDVEGGGALDMLLQRFSADGTLLSQKVLCGVSLQTSSGLSASGGRTLFATTICPFVRKVGLLSLVDS